jgi:thiosulfate/3-mercaptopyruvate sulfurtransferase
MIPFSVWSKLTKMYSYGTFKPADELRQIYGGQDINSDNDIITYCRIGERSAHTWFVLTHLLGYPRVRNYDGSWTEWGNLVRAPIEKSYLEPGRPFVSDLSD